jgi:hypothetical protein
MAWLQANWGALVAPLMVAILDLVFALKPNWASNGLLHWAFLQLGGKPPASS